MIMKINGPYVFPIKPVNLNMKLCDICFIKLVFTVIMTSFRSTSCTRPTGPDGVPVERHPGLAGGARGEAAGCDGPGRQVLVRPLRPHRHHQGQPGPAEGAGGARSRPVSRQTAAGVCGGAQSEIIESTN